MTRIAFLGSGNMAAAMVDGLLAQSPSDRPNLICFSASGKTSAALSARTGIQHATSLDDLITSAEVVVIAFKPQHLASADPRLTTLTQGKLVMSVLAGKRLERLAETFSAARNVVRTMPNTPSAIGAGITPYCALKPLSSADRGIVEKILTACGQHLEIGEEHMNAVTALSGGGPAFLFEFVAALRDAGIAAHLPAEVSNRLAVQTVLGAAKLLDHRRVDPEALRNQVTSPNGTTLAGLSRMSAGNFRGVLRETILAAQARAAELSQG
ncbi:MAG: pyrroline-5-carboxylate reductase [Opitutus sp.]